MLDLRYAQPPKAKPKPIEAYYEGETFINTGPDEPQRQPRDAVQQFAHQVMVAVTSGIQTKETVFYQLMDKLRQLHKHGTTCCSSGVLHTPDSTFHRALLRTTAALRAADTHQFFVQDPQLVVPGYSSFFTDDQVMFMLRIEERIANEKVC